MADGGSCFFNLLSRQSDCHANLQGRGNNLLGLKVILESLQATDEDTVCETLYSITVSYFSIYANFAKDLPRQQYLAARIAGRPGTASSQQQPQA